MTTTVFALSKAVSPITHMRGVSGNEGVLNREPIVTPRGVLYVPTLSGNALRHRCVRAPGAHWLVRRLDLVGSLSLQQLNFLFHGGALTEGGGKENLRVIADMQRLFPLLRLLGSSLPSQILAGSLQVWSGMLVCEENRSALNARLPKGWRLPDESLRPAESFTSSPGYQYTRGDAGKTVLGLAAKPDGECDENLMIFAGETVMRGACFVHGFTMPHASEVEVGALLLSLSLWQQQGGTIGGQAARGHGRLSTQVHYDGDGEAAVQAYIAHVDAVRDEAVKWLADVFAKKADKPKKGKRAAVAEPAEADA